MYGIFWVCRHRLDCIEGLKILNEKSSTIQKVKEVEEINISFEIADKLR
jgi:hypothetical protein